MLTAQDLLDAAEALAAVLDGDLPLMRDLARRDPVKLEQVAWALRDHAKGNTTGSPPWPAAIAAAWIVEQVANGHLVPKLTGDRADKIAEVQDTLTKLALEQSTSNRRARREKAAIDRRMLH